MVIGLTVVQRDDVLININTFVVLDPRLTRLIVVKVVLV